MYISKVSIRNYKNFSTACFNFNKGVNTIIGENGSGKTNLFKAVRLILDDNYYRYAYRLKSDDFNRRLSNWKGHWIIISVEFSDIPNDEAIMALFNHGTSDLICENDRATYNLIFRPKKDIRLRLSELGYGDNDGLNTILNSITIDNYETVFTGRSTVDFCDDAEYKKLIGDFDLVDFPFFIDDSKCGTIVPNQLSVTKEISFTFIQALRDVVSEFHNNKTNPLFNLLNYQGENIDEESFAPISEKVKSLNEEIEKLDEVKQVSQDIEETIKEAVGQTYSLSSLSIKSSLSEEIGKLLQSLRLYISEPLEDYESSIHELSLGGANLIYLSLKLLEYKYRRNRELIGNFLFIEEPEAHVHTHIQRSLFDKVSFDDTQIIYSTHSTHISEASKISNMNILARKKDFAEVYTPYHGLEMSNVRKIERYLDAVRSNLLFAKGVILVEGDAEEILIPIMIKNVLGISLDELGISIINIRSTGFENISDLFHQDRIRRKCAIITDMDKSINGTENDAEIKGRNRKEKLSSKYADNIYVDSFYAEHTFEIEIIKSGNADLVKSVVSHVYKDQSTINKSIEELSSSDVSVYGKRILTMANNQRKGWFALILGENISVNTVIPDYIFDALLFVKPNLIGFLDQIIEYRYKELKSIDSSVYEDEITYDTYKLSYGEDIVTKIKEASDVQMD